MVAKSRAQVVIALETDKKRTSDELKQIRWMQTQLKSDNGDTNRRDRTFKTVAFPIWGSRDGQKGKPSDRSEIVPD